MYTSRTLYRQCSTLLFNCFTPTLILHTPMHNTELIKSTCCILCRAMCTELFLDWFRFTKVKKKIQNSSEKKWENWNLCYYYTQHSVFYVATKKKIKRGTVKKKTENIYSRHFHKILCLDSVKPVSMYVMCIDFG